MSKQKLDIRSKYKDVNFSIKNVPSKFESVTDSAIRKTKRYSLNSVREAHPDYPAAALKAMIMSVAGDFNNLYATLEGDRASREAKLKQAYSDGYAALGKRITNFELLIQNHNAAFDRYNEISQELLGEKIDENLKYGEVKHARLAKKFEQMGE